MRESRHEGPPRTPTAEQTLRLPSVLDVADAVSGFIAVSLNVTAGDMLRSTLHGVRGRVGDVPMVRGRLLCAGTRSAAS